MAPVMRAASRRRRGAACLAMTWRMVRPRRRLGVEEDDDGGGNDTGDPGEATQYSGFVEYIDQKTIISIIH